MTAKRGTTNSNARAKPLLSSNFLFSVVAVAIVVFINSLIGGKASGELGPFLLMTSCYVTTTILASFRFELRHYD